MLDGTKAEAIIKEILKNWEVESLDAVAHLGGLITSWSPSLLKTDSRKLDSAIKTKLIDQEIGINYTLLNIYGPFFERKAFWENSRIEGAINQPNVILGGDLNLTLAAREI